MNSARKIQSGLGLVFLLLCMAHVGAAQTTCNPTWVSTTVYTAGMTVSLNGINYTANFWTQGQNPATNNGGPEVVSPGPAMDHVVDPDVGPRDTCCRRRCDHLLRRRLWY